MRRDPKPLEPFEERIIKKFPGLMPGSIFRLARIGRLSSHSTIYGELRRWQKLQSTLDAEAEELALLKLNVRKRRRLMQRALHDFYLDMYGGDEGDFKRNYLTWRDAVRDVEEMYGMLIGYLPRELVVDRETVDLHHRLHRPDEIRTEYDPIRLITLARTGGPKKNPWIRHCARIKLYLTQLFYEYRNEGFAPEDMAKETALVRRKIIDRLFARGSHKRVRVVADLDPTHSYECIDFRISDDSSQGFEIRDNRYVMEAESFEIRGGKRNIEVLFSIRPKEFVALKGIVKGIRLPQLANIGDRVAARFVFKDRSDLDDAVERIRDVIASRPGCVSNQDSTLEQNGSLDPDNPSSSPNFKAMKYNLQYIGIVAELQFMSVKDQVDARCRHDDANDGCYKLRQYCQSVLPISFPPQLTGIPWPTQFRKDSDRTVPTEHADIYEQLAQHKLHSGKAV
ncbi:hypothetical protein KKD88_03740 [Patescibacteria group bacterium]|nr:hypothetical protein [Patescibacteria group bacterium]